MFFFKKIIRKKMENAVVVFIAAVQCYVLSIIFICSIIKQGECQINFSAQHFSNIFLRNEKKSAGKFLWLLEAHAKEYIYFFVVINAVVKNFSRICGGFNFLYFFVHY